MRPSRKQISPVQATSGGAKLDDKLDTKSPDGCFQAMDQMANWVRFADTKATILTAGLGVVLTMLISNSKTIATAIKQRGPDAYIVGSLATLALFALGYTLFWLVLAIGPRSTVADNTFNRFAWPTLLNATTDQVISHTYTVDVRTDAWRQVVDLSVIAGRKFGACGHAVKGFAVLVVLGVACVATAIGFTT